MKSRDNNLKPNNDLAHEPRDISRIAHMRIIKSAGRLWLYANRASTYIQGEGIFYRWSTWLLGWLCGIHYVQQYFFSDNIRLLQRFISEEEIPVHNMELVQKQFFMQECLRIMRYEHALDHLSPSQLNQIIEIDSWDIFEQAYKAGNGVLLAMSHCGITRALLIYLDKIGLEFEVIGDIYRQLSKLQANDPALQKSIMHAKQLHAAFETLTEGQIACILPDGRHGTMSKKAPFLSRSCSFATGFAELACVTDAVVIPVEVMVDASQTIRIKFYAPLDKEAGTTDQEKVDALVEQYAMHLGQVWRDMPANTKTNRLYDYLNGRWDHADQSDIGRFGLVEA